MGRCWCGAGQERPECRWSVETTPRGGGQGVFHTQTTEVEGTFQAGGPAWAKLLRWAQGVILLGE